MMSDKTSVVYNEPTSYVPNTMVKGLSPQELMDAYRVRQNSDNPYDKNAVTVDYKGPRYVAQYLANSVPEVARESFQILDVGAGTGLIAEHLQCHGFRDIDALDPCEHMLRDAKTKGLYKRYHEMFLTGDSTGLTEDSYDAVVSNGCFVENHLQPEALKEMIRLVRPGGYIVIANRSSCLYTVKALNGGKLDTYMDKLEADGKWTRLARDTIPNFYLDCDGTIWKYRIL